MDLSFIHAHHLIQIAKKLHGKKPLLLIKQTVLDFSDFLAEASLHEEKPLLLIKQTFLDFSDFLTDATHY